MKTEKTVKARRWQLALGLASLGAALFVALSISVGAFGPLGEAVDQAVSGSVGWASWTVSVVLAGASVSLLLGKGYGSFRAFSDSTLVVLASTLSFFVFGLIGGGEIGKMAGEALLDSFGSVGGVLVTLLLVGLVVAERVSNLRSRGTTAARSVVGRVVRGLRGVASEVSMPRASSASSASSVEAAQTERLSPVRIQMTSVKVVDAEVVEESPSSPSSSPSSSPKNTSSYVFEQPKRAPSSPVSFPKNGKATSSFELPSSKLLSRGAATVGGVDSEVLQTEGELLIATLSAYNITSSLEEAVVGPSVVTYMTSLLAGTKLSRVIGLADDLALAFGKKVRVVPSRLGRIGFEVARDVRATVGLRELVEDLKFQSMKASLPIVIGRDVRGEGVFMDLAEAPHMIVAGSTGSGKSVGINTLLVSLLCRRTPDEVKLLLIDPKCVELLPFANLPHLLCPPVTTSSEAQVALSWCVREMERRYKLLASAGAKNITSYNAKTSSSSSLPFIVVVVDEAGDLMMQGGKEVESLLVRLGQKARASGIHIVLATQRPSVDILTGLIKSNFPARIAYRTAQSVDSRIVLDEVGAERLLGRGDALVRINGGDALVRAQGPLVSEEEIEAVVSHWCQQSAPRYDASVLEAAPSEEVKKASSSKATSSPSSRVWS